MGLPGRPATVAICALLVALAGASPAAAQDGEPSTAPGSTREPVIGGELPQKPDDYVLSAREAIRIADRSPDVAAASERPGRLETFAEAKPPGTWQIGYFADGDEVVQVVVDDPSATIRESWTGHQVAWQMARGYPEQFGHVLNAPYVWIPLAVAFFLGLLDWRRPWRIAHLDLLVLLSFGVSQLYFNQGEIGLSVPLAYPPLLYLLARMLWVGLGRRSEPLRPSLPALWMAIAVVFLLGFRIAINVADSGVIDVGYAGVIGADLIAEGEPVWGEKAFPEDNPTGDTYGPANYYAYVPFELVLPWSGSWDELPAAHGAAIFFDLATIAGLFLLGRRLAPGARRQGTALGVTLAFAWVAYPYTTFAMQSNSNDSLVAALLVWALVLFGSPAARGALLGLAAMVKFAPLALVPLFAAGHRGMLGSQWGRRPRLAAPRPLAWFAAAFVAVTALMLAHPIVEPGLAAFWERTVASQLDRESPFSVWGQEPGLETVQAAVLIAAAVLAAAVAFLPRRRSLAQVAALAAAVLIATQLAVDHWFYLYLPWFFGLAIAAIAAPRRGPGGSQFTARG